MHNSASEVHVITKEKKKVSCVVTWSFDVKMPCSYNETSYEAEFMPAVVVMYCRVLCVCVCRLRYALYWE